MEDKGGSFSGDSWTEWFTVLKVPIAKIIVGDQVFFFSPTRRVTTPSQLLAVLKEDAWRIIDKEKTYEASFHEEARLFDYFTGEEAPISVLLLTAGAGWKLRREKARQIPIHFQVTLYDKMWNKEKEITTQGVLEVYSLKAEFRIAPSQDLPGYREETIIEGKKFVRLHGLFTTEFDPFTPKDDPISSELLQQAKLNGEVLRIKHHRYKKNLSSYMDITFFLKK
ncbi:MAG: hypothetical protein LM590_00650 [Thermofilum sp.]|jgi:hypothetical protein|nr:hypothetical protein [Thermofilum sp.]